MIVDILLLGCLLCFVVASHVHLPEGQALCQLNNCYSVYSYCKLPLVSYYMKTYYMKTYMNFCGSQFLGHNFFVTKFCVMW